MVREMTKGKPFPLIIGFAWPLLIGSLFQQLYNVIDSVVVGQVLGADALAAVGSTGALNFLIIGFVLGISTGFCIPVAQQFGAEKLSEMRKFVANAVYLCGILTVVLTAVTLFFTRNLLELMGTPNDIIDMAYDYIIVIFIGIFAIILYNLPAGLLRALGDSRTPLYFLIIAALLNAVLDVMFIAVMGMGVAAAGWATVIAQLVSGLLCILYIRKRYPILHFFKHELKFSWQHSKKILAIGIPMGAQSSITAIGSVILQSSVNSLGTQAIAAVTTSNRISNMTFQPFDVLGLTMATFCGQNLGAGQLQRIKNGIRVGIYMMMVYCAAAIPLLFFGGEFFASLFMTAGEETATIIGDAQFMLRVISLFYPSLGLLLLLRFSLQGLGFSILPMSAGFAELIARVLVALLLVGPLGFLAVCLASPIAWLAACALLIPAYFICIRSVKRRLTQVITATPTVEEK
jgi:putative MATE family efflux protein